MFAAGWSEHNRCLCCLSNPVVAEALKCGCSMAPAREEQNLEAKQVVATAKQIAEAPIGNLNHRIWGCQSEPMQHEREKWATKQDMQKEVACEVSGHPAWERGMTLRPAKPMRQAAQAVSFKWNVEHEGEMFEIVRMGHLPWWVGA